MDRWFSFHFFLVFLECLVIWGDRSLILNSGERKLLRIEECRERFVVSRAGEL